MPTLLDENCASVDAKTLCDSLIPTIVCEDVLSGDREEVVSPKSLELSGRIRTKYGLYNEGDDSLNSKVGKRTCEALLIRNAMEYIASIFLETFVSGDCVDDDNVLIAPLIAIVEIGLFHGLRSVVAPVGSSNTNCKQSSLRQSQDSVVNQVWSLIKKINYRGSTTAAVQKNVDNFTALRDGTRKLRAWIRLALMSKCIAGDLTEFHSEELALINRYYSPWALIRSDHFLPFVASLAALDGIHLNIFVSENSIPPGLVITDEIWHVEGRILWGSLNPPVHFPSLGIHDFLNGKHSLNGYSIELSKNQANHLNNIPGGEGTLSVLKCKNRELRAAVESSVNESTESNVNAGVLEFQPLEKDQYFDLNSPAPTDGDRSSIQSPGAIKEEGSLPRLKRSLMSQINQRAYYQEEYKRSQSANAKLLEELDMIHGEMARQSRRITDLEAHLDAQTQTNAVLQKQMVSAQVPCQSEMLAPEDQQRLFIRMRQSSRRLEAALEEQQNRCADLEARLRISEEQCRLLELALSNASAISDLKLAQNEEKWSERLKLVDGQLVVANSLKEDLLKRLSGQNQF